MWLAYHLATLVHRTLVCIRFYTFIRYARSIIVLCLIPFAQSINVPLFLYRLWLFFVAYSLPLECTIIFDRLSLKVCPMHSVLLSAFFDIWEMGLVVSSFSHFCIGTQTAFSCFLHTVTIWRSL